MRALASLLLIVLVVLAGAGPAAASPEGQMTWAVHISLAPTWFDPAETPGIGTPFMILYALHDALVKPMPGNAMAPSLAESWSLSKDGLVQEFVLRQGARFHNGDPVTADDVKFSFERYRGAANKLMKDKVAAIDVVDPHRVRFRFKEPWPDFMTYYGSLTTGAGWIVPRKYLEKVGDDGFKKAPVGAGPYRFASFNPGIELTLEAHEQYWRKVPSVKRLVLRSAPDEATRLAMLKRGEADIVYLLQAELAEDVRRTAGLTLRPTPIVSTHWLVFTDQRSPSPRGRTGGSGSPPITRSTGRPSTRP
jgi:peptide/nickel transport system substrate-binding protein